LSEVAYLVIPDEGTFHLFEYVNRKDNRLWDSENPHSVTKHLGERAKVIGAL
jgi:hypothetical protein